MRVRRRHWQARPGRVRNNVKGCSHLVVVTARPGQAREALFYRIWASLQTRPPGTAPNGKRALNLTTGTATARQPVAYLATSRVVYSASPGATMLVPRFARPMRCIALAFLLVAGTEAASAQANPQTQT